MDRDYNNQIYDDIVKILLGIVGLFFVFYKMKMVWAWFVLSDNCVFA